MGRHQTKTNEVSQDASSSSLPGARVDKGGMGDVGAGDSLLVAVALQTLQKKEV